MLPRTTAYLICDINVTRQFNSVTHHTENSDANFYEV